MRKPEIIVTDNGFAIVTAKATDTISLREISAMIAYKIDELPTDLVCCDIVTGSANGEQVRTVHEETPRFDALMARFEALPGFNPKWREAVILPPFATNRTTIYYRSRQRRLTLSQTDSKQIPKMPLAIAIPERIALAPLCWGIAISVYSGF